MNTTTNNTTNTPDLLDVLRSPLMRADEVAFVRIGRSKRFDRRAIAQWVDAHANR
jgi:hypothetical protein